MGPIWEANHMWLIIAVVILFVGFPEVYTTVSIYLHLPLVVMLFGIIARGTSFAFRNYDAVKDHWQKFHSIIFVCSCFITPLFLGIIAGSAISRSIDPGAVTFTSAYIDSWLNWFSISTGLFTVSLCGFLASVYLIGEVQNQDARRIYIQNARVMNLAMFVCVLGVFIAAFRKDIPLASWLFGNSVGRAAVACSVISLVLVWAMINKGKVRAIRFFTGFMVTTLLAAVTYAHFPHIVLFKNGDSLSLLKVGSAKAIQTLGIALLSGSILILPAFIYLVYRFGRKNDRETHVVD
jgi:cytochrome d ubiquinol oxidase subunit II